MGHGSKKTFRNKPFLAALSSQRGLSYGMFKKLSLVFSEFVQIIPVTQQEIEIWISRGDVPSQFRIFACLLFDGTGMFLWRLCSPNRRKSRCLMHHVCPDNTPNEAKSFRSEKGRMREGLVKRSEREESEWANCTSGIRC
jgi:hypothetical protein